MDQVIKLRVRSRSVILKTRSSVRAEGPLHSAARRSSCLPRTDLHEFVKMGFYGRHDLLP